MFFDEGVCAAGQRRSDLDDVLTIYDLELAVTAFLHAFPKIAHEVCEERQCSGLVPGRVCQRVDQLIALEVHLE
jgi:hypothetical protein